MEGKVRKGEENVQASLCDDWEEDVGELVG